MMSLHFAFESPASVCLSMAACLHYCMNPDVTWGSGKGCPPSCALLGGFATGCIVMAT